MHARMRVIVCACECTRWDTAKHLLCDSGGVSGRTLWEGKDYRCGVCHGVCVHGIVCEVIAEVDVVVAVAVVVV